MLMPLCSAFPKFPSLTLVLNVITVFKGLSHGMEPEDTEAWSCRQEH